MQSGLNQALPVGWEAMLQAESLTQARVERSTAIFRVGQTRQPGPAVQRLLDILSETSVL